MPGTIKIRVLHDKHLDIVRDESADEGALEGLTEAQAEKAQREDHVLSGGVVHKSLDTYQVAAVGRGGTEINHKIEVKEPGHFTEVEFPEGYEGSAIEITHIIDSLKDRMVGEHATGVVLVKGDGERLATRFAALLDVDYLGQEASA